MLEVGKLEEVGGLSALLIDSSELALRPGQACFDTVPYERIEVALFGTDQVSPCEVLADDACPSTDDIDDAGAP